MSCTDQIAAHLRRSSRPSADRVQFLLYALDSMSCGCDELIAESTEKTKGLSAPSLCRILQYAFPGESPHFVFTLSIKGALYRSPDRGASWRLVHDAMQSAELAAPPPVPSAKDEGDHHLNNIMQLLPREEDELDELDEQTGDDGEDVITPSPGPTSDPTSSRSTCLACDGRVVVVGGSGNMLIVSGDRGVHFTPAPGGLWDAFGGGRVDISNAALAGEGTLLLAAGPRVVAVSLHPSGTGSVEFGSASAVLTCKGCVCLLTALPAAGGARHAFVAEAGTLHFSWDAGRHFVAIPHKLGFIRSIAACSAKVRASSAPPFPSDCSVVRAVLTEGPSATGADVSGRLAERPYEYAVGFRRAVDDDADGSLHSHLKTVLASTFLSAWLSGKVYYQNYVVLGAGSEVLPYDYSARLCIGLQIDPASLAVFSHATCVSFTPFARSTVTEAVACAVASTPGSEKVVVVRGGSSGVSFSQDGAASWSTLQKAATVAVLALDGGEVLVCGARSTTTTIKATTGGTVAATTVAGDFRAPSSIVAAASV